MTELKTVVVLGGEIINVGEWDYQYIEQPNDDGTVSQVTQNPLPDGASIEQREMTYSTENGWRLTDAALKPSNDEISTAKIETATLNLLIDLGVI